MDHPFFSFRYLDNRAHCIKDFYYSSFVFIADFHIFEDSFDKFERCLTSFLRLRRHRTLPVIFEIHLDTIVFLDLLDRLTSLSDHFAHLLFWYEYCEEKWSKWREFLTRLG
jgi:hypothetical protein